MNIRRGLFRLWVVFSALFVIGVGSNTFDDIRNEFKREAERAQTEPLPFKQQQKPAEYNYAEELLNPPPPQQQKPAENRSSEPKPRARWQDAPIIEENTEPAPWRLLSGTLAFAVGVPLALLALGSVLVWVAAGFFRSTNRT